jgi:hypothetical protein
MVELDVFAVTDVDTGTTGRIEPSRLMWPTM